MEESESKICPNCKREIPVVNYTIHTVHCARNIRVCPVCKEPVPQQELQEHHEKYHKLLPCKQCGESVCGTDLEDHIRDSCAHTIKSCRYCELELPRRELPGHESYCGVRTEQCPDCKEWVMIKYRQLHLDSNHGFLRLDDDPVPQPKKEPPKLNIISRDILAAGSSTNGIQNAPTRANRPIPKRANDTTGSSPLGACNRPFGITNGFHGQMNTTQVPKTTIRYFGNSNSSSDPQPSGSNLSRSNFPDLIRLNDCAASGSGVSQEVKKVPLKRTNDQPQINTAVHVVDKVNKELPLSRGGGAVKKRPAPKPPARAPPDPRRDLAYHSALLRHQQEERRREDQSARNLAQGLPPVLSPAAKLEKLRKMDALQNREVVDKDYKNRLQGRVWMSPDMVLPVGHRLGSSSPDNTTDLENRRNEFKDLKPMTTQEFMERFKELELNMPSPEDRVERQERTSANGSDRFSEIKSSLRELRRGLNEVTAPYNSNLNAASNNAGGGRSASRSPLPSPEAEAEAEVRLPCEFCGAAVLEHDLVMHQTGCRPDLAQLRPRSSSPPLARAAPPRQPAAPPLDLPVIPCEFCAESLPVYLITEHQERCRNESDLLF